MALLYYQNLGVKRPDIMMKSAFYGLKDFYDFLKRTKSYMDSDAAVMRLAWEPSWGPEDEDSEPTLERKGYWIQLKEPKDRPNEPEATFRAFLDENVSKVFEANPKEKRGKDSQMVKYDFSTTYELEVLDRDPQSFQLLVVREPKSGDIVLRPNTWPLQCQIRAIQRLQDSPTKQHRPLLRLLESSQHASWPAFYPASVEEDQWMVLTDVNRPGTDEQREFVEMALETPDFAFLEGPPGSGKTTAICELILQLALEGKRVLLCGSTHVAVDNVLERLMDHRNDHRDLVIPVRVGDRKNVSEKAREWQLEEFVKTERKRLLSELRRLSDRSPSQKEFYDILQSDSSMVERIVLDAANLVCGTTIGILQHPDIKGRDSQSPAFDVLILDEASKTTFQEFLVPAMFTRRWVIVGDPKQLSPFVDDAAMATNLETCLQSDELRAACVDTFFAGHPNQRRQRTIIATATPRGIEAYRAQAEAHGVNYATTDVPGDQLSKAVLVFGEVEEISEKMDQLPLDASFLRAPSGQLDGVRRRVVAWNRLQKRREELPSWSNELSWRLARHYEQRMSPSQTASQLWEAVEQLLPVNDKEKVYDEIERVRRVALPSVLEALRCGFERNSHQRVSTALTDGLPEHVLRARHKLLSTQHRMHSEIAHFSHHHIYEGEALVTPPYLDETREWSYPRYSHRALWVDVRGKFNSKNNSNNDEASKLINELSHFDVWARQNRRDSGPWEVAILCFYRGQERELRKKLRKWAKDQNSYGHFRIGPKSSPYLTIELCTVDRFQGHEADLVFITLANSHATSFLESPNRLNVALTRARYQRVMLGHRTQFFDERKLKENEAQRSLLAELAAVEKWDSTEVSS